jgi:hypothetical protein
VEANVSTEGARETELGKKMIKEKIQSDIEQRQGGTRGLARNQPNRK